MGPSHERELTKTQHDELKRHKNHRHDKQERLLADAGERGVERPEKTYYMPTASDVTVRFFRKWYHSRGGAGPPWAKVKDNAKNEYLLGDILAVNSTRGGGGYVIGNRAMPRGDGGRLVVSFSVGDGQTQARVSDVDCFILEWSALVLSAPL